MASMLISFVAILLLQPAQLTTAEARAHIGEQATVCGVVKSARWASSSNRKPTFLNLDEAYPKQAFTVVIFEENRGKFTPAPEEQFKDKRICVTGKIEEFRGVPEIVVTAPAEIVETPAAAKRERSPRVRPE
jgi:DNA/RNA endonuclease YhcR with UshA esterase domain